MAKALRGDVDEDGLPELCDVDTTLLEVCLTAHLSGWVELGSTGTVRVPSAYLRALACDFTFACHSRRMLAYPERYMQTDLETSIFTIVVLIFSIILHEVAHGYAANALGDPTAKLSGRLTMNPLPHIDPIGSVLLPGLLVLTSSGFLFGWAKPVPYNPYNLRNQRWGEAMVGIAGVATNLLLAVLFALIARVAYASGATLFGDLSALVVFVNLFLGLFNLIPFPPLDGFTVLRGLLPSRLAIPFRAFEERFLGGGVFSLLLFLIVFSYFFVQPFAGFVLSIFRVLLG